MINEELQCKIKRAEDEYESLKDRVHDLYDENKDLKEEIERLNNIINELKDFLIAYENNRDSFKWNEQDYIDTIEKIEEIIEGESNE